MDKLTSDIASEEHRRSRWESAIEAISNLNIEPEELVKVCVSWCNIVRPTLDIVGRNIADCYTFDQYETEALDAPIAAKYDLCCYVMGLANGLAGEVVEIYELVKKEKHHKEDTPTGIYVDKLGDVLWYLTMLTRNLGLSLEDVAKANIERLRKRHNIDRPSDLAL